MGRTPVQTGKVFLPVAKAFLLAKNHAESSMQEIEIEFLRQGSALFLKKENVLKGELPLGQKRLVYVGQPSCSENIKTIRRPLPWSIPLIWSVEAQEAKVGKRL